MPKRDSQKAQQDAAALPTLKSVMDGILSTVHGIEMGEISGMPAYFVGKRMFACIANGGVGIRLSAAAATELQFSNANTQPFVPKGLTSTREWVQINHADLSEYEKDRELFMASAEFVRNSRT
jgi:hypothetical protein